MKIKNIIVENEHGECIGWDEFNQLVHKERVSYDKGKTFEPDSWRFTFVSDFRSKTCALCGRKWETTVESMIDTHVAHNKPVHYSCFERYLGFKQLAFIESTICDHHFPFSIKEIPNEYGAAWNTPWYLIDVLKQDEKQNNHPTSFSIKYGRRKRVCEVRLQVTDNKSICLKPTPILVEMGKNATSHFEPDHIMLHTYTDDDTKKVIAEFAEILKDYGI